MRRALPWSQRKSELWQSVETNVKISEDSKQSASDMAVVVRRSSELVEG